MSGWRFLARHRAGPGRRGARRRPPRGLAALLSAGNVLGLSATARTVTATVAHADTVTVANDPTAVSGDSNGDGKTGVATASVD